MGDKKRESVTVEVTREQLRKRQQAKKRPALRVVDPDFDQDVEQVEAEILNWPTYGEMLDD